nr:ADP-ribosyltransferase [Leifsonia psychrotolerans]
MPTPGDAAPASRPEVDAPSASGHEATPTPGDAAPSSRPDLEAPPANGHDATPTPHDPTPAPHADTGTGAATGRPSTDIHTDDFDAKFDEFKNELDADFDKLKHDTEVEFDKITDDIDAKFDELDANLDAGFDKLEADLDADLDKLEADSSLLDGSNEDGSSGAGTDGGGSDGTPAHVPAHTDLEAPPVGADATTPLLPDLADIDAKYRDAKDEIPENVRDEWAAAVSARYPTLSKEDVLGAYHYTTNAYDEMNKFLRDIPTGSSRATLEAHITATTNALAKLPPVPGTSFRGMELRTGLLEQFEVGKPWSDPAFMSSSTSPLTAKNFTGEIMVTIEAQSGVDVSRISAYRPEAEVLFQRGTTFEVVSKYQDTNGVWQIALREVSR